MSSEEGKKSKGLLAIIGLFLVAVVTVVLYLFTLDRPLGEGYKTVDEYGGEFSLISKDGTVRLSDFKGKAVVAYFGFVKCHNACPISLDKIRKVLDRMSEAELAQVQVVFVSIDPENDTPEEMDKYLKSYHPNILGLTDSRESVDIVLKQYGVFSDKDILNGESTTYTIDHSSRFYLIDKQGKLVTTMSHSTTPAELLAKIKTL